jgi:hypothetical protein
MLYNVKVNHDDLGEFESAEKLWQAISEADLVTGDLADWEDIDDSSVPSLLKAAQDQGFIDDYDLEEVPDREPLEDYLDNALDYPEQVGADLAAVLTGAREFAGLKITDDQIKEYVRQYNEGADSHTGLYDEIMDQVVRAIESVDYDKLVRWTDWVGGDDTAANLLSK